MRELQEAEKKMNGMNSGFFDAEGFGFRRRIQGLTEQNVKGSDWNVSLKMTKPVQAESVFVADAVGTLIAERPPHRSVRALLRIRLPPSDG
jgi:hypothetical protein